MKIERIVKKGSKNVVIHLGNGEKLYLAYEILLKNNLRKNQEIPENKLGSLIKQNREFFVRESALRYLSRRLHSVKELRLKLIRKKFEQEFIDKIINELIEKGFLNDFQFASEFAEHKSREWGKEKLKSELIRKGIGREIIDQILLNNLSEENDYINAKKLAAKKYKILSGRKSDDKKIREKVFSFLIYKGYDYELSKNVTEEIVELKK